MVRTTGRVLGLALLSTCAAVAQEAQQAPPFRVEQPFAGGERWALRQELVTHEVDVGQAEERAEVNRIVWTETAEVLERTQGFALRLTFDSFRVRSSAPNVESRITYDAEDLRDLPRTWTFEYGPAWTLLDVSGQRETFRALYDRMLKDARAGQEREGCGAWFARRARPYVVDRWSRGYERWQKRAINDGGAPLRAVMGRLGEGRAIEPGFEARFEAVGEWPAGTVRYEGRDEQGARFVASFDAPADQAAPEYSFVVDDAGRLARLEARRTQVVGQRRVSSEYRFTLDVLRSSGIDAGQPTGDGEPGPTDEPAGPGRRDGAPY